jgi:AraC-like DNA-binding protein
VRPKPPDQHRVDAAFDFAASLAAESVPRPIAALPDSLPRGALIPPHRHRRAQLVYAVSGTMTVQAAGNVWTLPPSHALWIPAGVVHQIRMNGSVEMRTLYIRPRQARHIDRRCRVLFVSPLLRELILRAMQLPALYDERGMPGRVMRLIVDEIARLPAQPLALPMPRDPRLVKLCGLLLREVSTSASIAQLGACVGLSERSVMRLFVAQTGLSFRRWRNQARLLKAFELFDEGRSVTRVALDVGYASPSAFARMFRRAFGRSPTKP